MGFGRTAQKLCGPRVVLTLAERRAQPEVPRYLARRINLRTSGQKGSMLCTCAHDKSCAPCFFRHMPLPRTFGLGALRFSRLELRNRDSRSRTSGPPGACHSSFPRRERTAGAVPRLELELRCPIWRGNSRNRVVFLPP